MKPYALTATEMAYTTWDIEVKTMRNRRIEKLEREVKELTEALGLTIVALELIQTIVNSQGTAIANIAEDIRIMKVKNGT